MTKISTNSPGLNELIFLTSHEQMIKLCTLDNDFIVSL